jgi:hypothetical protein
MEPAPSRPATRHGMDGEEMQRRLSERNHVGSDDDCELQQWMESFSTTQDELKILLAHPDYALYQAKQYARAGKMDGHPKNGVLNLLSQFQGRYGDGWRKLIKTVTETVHHNHLRGHH